MVREALVREVLVRRVLVRALRLTRADPGLAVAAVLALLILAPLLRRGFVLSWDMVFVPEPPLNDRLLGLDGAPPRGVPADAIVAFLARAVPADMVQKVILLASLVVGGWGAARLAPVSGAAKGAAAAFYLWNAYVYERLVLGHWSLLVSLAALPWVARAAVDMRHGLPRARRRLVAALAVASFGSASGGLVAVGTALLIVIVPRSAQGGGPAPRGGADGEDSAASDSAAVGKGGRQTKAGRNAAVVGAAGMVLALPWLVPTLMRPDALPARPEAVGAFSATADTPLGLLGSLLTLGGIWAPQVVPPGRNTLVTVPALVAMTAAAISGWCWLARRFERGAALGLSLAAVAGLSVALAGAIPGLRGALEVLVTVVPGAGLLRDGQRYLAPLVLLQALGFAAAVDWLLRQVRSAWRLPVAVGAAAIPVLLLPVLAWGAGGRLVSVEYPADYWTVRAVVDGDPEPGNVLILPWAQYIAPAWNGGRPVFDPAQRWFSRPALGSAELVVLGTRIEAEDERVLRADRVVRGTEPLRETLDDIGVRYVLVNKLEGWEASAERLDGLDVVHDGEVLRLYRRDAQEEPLAPGSHRQKVPIMVGTAFAVALAVWAWVTAFRIPPVVRKHQASPSRAEEKT